MSYGKPPASAKYARTMVSSLPREIAYTNIKKEKKMGWFKRKFAQWSREAWESRANTGSGSVGAYPSQDSVSAKSSVRFTVYPASGGYVIQHHKQDNHKDSDGPTLTIVSHGEELGKAVEHIITLEALRS